MKPLTVETVLSQIADHGREGRLFIESRPEAERVPALCGALATDAPARNRSIVCNIMASNPQREYLPALLDTLSTEDEGLLSACADALGNVSQTFPPTEELKAALGEKLMALLSSDATPEGAKGALIYAIGLLRYSAAHHLLIELLDHDKAMVRWNAAEALSHLGDEAAIPHLRKRLENEDNPRSRRIMQMAIGYLSEGQG